MEANRHFQFTRHMRPVATDELVARIMARFAARQRRDQEVDSGAHSAALLVRNPHPTVLAYPALVEGVVAEEIPVADQGIER